MITSILAFLLLFFIVRAINVEQRRRRLFEERWRAFNDAYPSFRGDGRTKRRFYEIWKQEMEDY